MTLGIIMASFGVHHACSYRRRGYAKLTPETDGDQLVTRVLPPYCSVFAGTLSGILSGALNEGGPPLVMYLSALRWKTDHTKFLLNAVFTCTSLYMLTVMAVKHILQ